jgi:hypothetical protein
MPIKYGNDFKVGEVYHTAAITMTVTHVSGMDQGLVVGPPGLEAGTRSRRSSKKTRGQAFGPAGPCAQTGPFEPK